MPTRIKKTENKLIISENLEYKVNELVFAKVRGFADWPARITSIVASRYNLTFFGDNTT